MNDISHSFAIIIREKNLKWNRPESGSVKRKSWLINLIAQAKNHTIKQDKKTPSSLLFIVQVDIWKLFHFNAIRALLAHVTSIVVLEVRSNTFEKWYFNQYQPFKISLFKKALANTTCGYLQKKDSHMKTVVLSWYDAGNKNNPCITVRQKRWKKCLSRRAEYTLQGAVLYFRLFFLFSRCISNYP